MACTNEEFRGNTVLRHVKRISVNNEGTFVYMTSRDGNVSGFSLDLTDASPLGSVTTINRICESVNNPTLRSDIMYATTVAVSPDNSNILYTGSHVNHAIQKLELTDTTCTVLESIGAGINSVLANKGTSADTDADDIRFSRVWGMHVNENGKILTATGRLSLIHI